MTMTMAMARRATARRDMMTTTMVTGDDDNAVDGDGTMGNEVDDVGDGVTGDNNDNDNNGDDIL
jgi:hypothetical protein